jgi:hypothetical protein
MGDTGNLPEEETMIRSVLAVVAGYVVICAIVLTFSWLLPPTTVGSRMLFVAYGFLAALTGGYVAAVLAGRAPFRHAVALACAGVTLALLSLVFSLEEEPLWFHLANTAVPTAGVLLGGWLKERQARARTLAPAH